MSYYFQRNDTFAQESRLNGNAKWEGYICSSTYGHPLDFELSKLIEKLKMAAEVLLATELAPEFRFVTCILLKYSLLCSAISRLKKTI
jgi:hypothetical protein